MKNKKRWDKIKIGIACISYFYAKDIIFVLAINCAERIILDFTDNLIYEDFFFHSENRFPLVHRHLCAYAARKHLRRPQLPAIRNLPVQF